MRFSIFAFFLAAFVLPPIVPLRALTADTLLATPPTAAELSDPAKAQERVAQIERLSKVSPTRAVELEASAIPFRRALEHTTAVAAKPSGRTYWILVNAPDGPTIIHALSAKRQGSAVVIEDEAKRRSVWDRLRILGALPWLTDRDFETLSSAQIEQIVRQYQARAQRTPPLRAPLLAEAERIRAAAKMFAAQQAARQSELDAWLAKKLSLSARTQPSDLATHLLAGEKLRRAIPNEADRIEAAAAPYWEALRAFWSGKAFDGARWIDGEEARQFQNAEKLGDARAKVLADFRLKVDGNALSSSEVRSFLQWTFGAYFVAIIVGILLLLGRGALVRLGGFLLFAAGVAGLIYWYWPLLGTPAPATASGGGRADPALETIANANEVKMGFLLRTAKQRNVALTEQDLNAFLRERLTFEVDPASAGLVRKSVAVRITAGQLIVDERGEWNGRPFALTYEFPVQSGKDEVDFGVPKVSLNGVVLSARSADPLRENLRRAVARAASQTGMSLSYRVSGLQPGTIELAARGPAPTPAPTPTPPPATPAPTATPVPTPTPDPDAELYELLGQDKFGNPLPPKAP